MTLKPTLKHLTQYCSHSVVAVYDCNKLLADVEHTKKRPRTDREDPDWEPGASSSSRQRKRPCNLREGKHDPGASSLDSARMRGGDKSAARLEREKTRVLRVWQQVSEKVIVDRLRQQLESASATANSALIDCLSKTFDQKTYPHPSAKIWSVAPTAAKRMTMIPRQKTNANCNMK